MGNGYTDFRALLVYQKAYHLACDIFEMTSSFPREEVYSLTDQIRRASRSVCANLAEAYRKRPYRKHFLLKLTDCLGENSETQVWLDFSFHCKYIDEENYRLLTEATTEVGRLLTYMYHNPDKYGVAPE